MPKPVIIAKSADPEWNIMYDDATTDESSTLTIFGSPTIRDAITEAEKRLDQDRQGWYTITGVELIKRRLAYHVELSDMSDYTSET